MFLYSFKTSFVNILIMHTPGPYTINYNCVSMKIYWYNVSYVAAADNSVIGWFAQISGGDLIIGVNVKVTARGQCHQLTSVATIPVELSFC